MIPDVCAVAIVSCVMCVLLDGLGFRSRGLLTTLCALMILSALTSSLGKISGDILSLAERSGILDAATVALRAIGLGYVVGITADVCAGLGEGMLSTAVITVGRVQIFMVAYPYLQKIINLGIELIG